VSNERSVSERPPRAEPRKFVVARVEDVPDGERIIVNVQGRDVGVFNVGGEYYAFSNRCPHKGGPLCLGEIAGLIEADAPGQFRFDADRKLLMCPWHGWEFDLKDGQSYLDPVKTRARPYPVEVEQGTIIARALEEGGEDAAGQLVKGPYVADVIPVSVESDYLVVTIRT
jgi:nitrite reductase/ring-hydroxylating ferredoxin subunit